MNVFQREIYETIDILTEEKLKQLGFDKTSVGRVVSVGDTSCVVRIDGEEYTCRMRRGVFIESNDIVFVKSPKNNDIDRYVDAVLGGNEVPESMEMSAQEILQKLRTVDGAGSGLDADTLDGKHADEFATLEDLEGLDVDISGQKIVEQINLSESTIDDKNLSENVNDAIDKKHSHINKSTIDSIKQDDIDTWNTVINKVDKVVGKQLSTEDYTTVEKSKLAGIETGANKYVHPGTGTNPHGTIQADIGLSNVENKSSATIRSEITNSNVTSALGYTPENSANKGVANGYVPLDSNIKIPLSMLPDIAKQQTYVVGTIADRDTLVSLIMGEKCYITETGDSYIWDSAKWVTLAKADWENVNLQWTNIVGKPQSNVVDIDDATTKRHIHLNKSIIDTITQTLINRWNSAWEHISDNIKHITSSERIKWNTVDNKADSNYVDVELGKKQDSLGFTPLKEIPVATITELGGIKVGANLSIATDGTLSAVDDDSKSTFIVKQEIFTATEGQTLFNLTKGNYQPNTNTISVYLYGGKQPNTILNEISTNSFEITQPLKDGDIVIVEYIELSSATPYPMHGNDHLAGGYDPIPRATTSSDGLMAKEDKAKLDGVETGANKYTHPATHLASVIIESSTKRFVTDTEKATWDAKETTTGAQAKVNAHANKVDNPHSTTKSQVGLDSVQNYGVATQVESEIGSSNAKYMTPLRTKQAIDKQVADKDYATKTELNSGLTGKVDNSRVLTDVPTGAKFSDTVTTINGKTGSITKDDITALGIPSQDTVYTHPTTAGNKHIPTGGTVGQVLKNTASGTVTWQDEYSYTHPSSHSISEISGLQGELDSKVDNDRVLTDVPVNAKFTDTVYTHPSSHPASIITESTTKRFVSDTEKSTWNAKASTSVATTSADGLMANTDKAKLDGVQAGAQVNTVTSVAGKTGAVIVTKADVALGSVLNYGLSTQLEAETGTSNAKYMTPLRTKQAIDKQVGDKNYVTQDELGDAGFGDMVKSIYDTNSNGIVDNAEKVNGFTVGINVPSNAKFTDTIYTHPASHPYSMITGTPTSLPANGGQSDTTKGLVGDDTRAVNSPPSEYMSGGARYLGRAGWQTEFKNVATMGVGTYLSGTYCYVETKNPWSDPSGGYPIQIAYGNGYPCWRVGISATSWGAWKSLSETHHVGANPPTSTNVPWIDTSL